jgi:isoleucyl-tRNA synthetase
MIELNKTINWKPASTGTGRFGKWLENLNDWNLSRSRFWGTPLPIWRSESGEEICIGSVEELIAEIEKSVKAGFMKENPYKNFKVGDFSEENYSVKNIDLHRPYIDNVILVSPTGKPMKRETDLIDVWFDSGAMPYAQIHYPFENKEALDSGKIFPADFINEGVDQTRGWFFTLHAIASMLFDSVAFKNVISNGLVLDKNGGKMSKRLGNAVNPFEVIEKYGSDAVRWYMITNAAPWDNLEFDVEGVAEVQRKFFGTLYNTYSFFALYANVDGFDGSQPQIAIKDRPEIDRWIISLLNTLIKDVDEALNTLSDEDKDDMPERFLGASGKVAAELISGCDILSGQGYDCNGTLVSGVYFRAKSGETSDPAGNIILLPFTTDDSGGYYWLSGGAKILHISTSGAASIINANENSFAAVRTVTR